jgi:ribosomal protein L11 methylase PrmA
VARYPALDVRYEHGPDTGVLHDLLYAGLDSFEPLAIHDLETGDGWRVFFRLPAQRDAARAALASSLGDRLLELSPADVDDEDWARRSQAALTAIQVGRIIVAPPWDPNPEPPAYAAERLRRGRAVARTDCIASTGGRIPNPESRVPRPESRIPNPESRIPSPGSRTPSPDMVIIIEPSMGFGTGHHETTRLCLELLQTLELQGRRVIDVGTGSGVLALAAAKLGASAVTAMDTDPDALQNARENIARNNLTDAIHVVEADLSEVALQSADVVVANLTGAVLQRCAGALRRLTAPAGMLIVSGFSPEELDGVVRALALPISTTSREGEWAAALLRST